MGKAQSKSEPSMDTSMKAPQMAAQSPVTIPKLDTDFLLQPPDETSIKRSWMQLSNLIDSHVQAFYDVSDRFNGFGDLIKEDLREYRVVKEQEEAEELTELLRTPRYRKLGLRICIARVVLSSIDFHGHPKETSLDPQVVALLGRFTLLRPDRSPEEEAALSHWRMITAFFLAPGSRDLRDRKPPCVDLLTEFLAVFRPRSGSEEDDQNWTGSLVTIVQKGIDVGEKLFCHPSTWLFDWHPKSACDEVQNQLRDIGPTTRLPRPIVLFPALTELVRPGDGDPKGGVNVVQAADIGPGLVFLEDEILPLASFRSSSPTASSSSQTRPGGGSAAGAPGRKIGDQLDHHSHRKRGSFHSVPAGQYSTAIGPGPSDKPPRRSSTMDSASQLRHWGTASREVDEDSCQSHSARRSRKRDKLRGITR
ncbi:HNH nuclease domain-containing protein [Madurella fahalii]|uniref:HNH nuclease domain-containing protein n=1 Tax=Madurella fahalii TaxID=1157608 RepID=A0ABQ0GFI6_9PEZI